MAARAPRSNPVPDEGLAKPKFCANCLGKMEMLDIRPEGVYCQCSHCRRQTFSTCGACKTVPYCSKACQVEHWKSNHKSLCSIFSGKQAGFRLNLSDTEGMRPREVLTVIHTERWMESYYWALFKSDRGMLAPGPQDRESLAEQMRRTVGPPFPLNVSDDQQNGWIADYLGFFSCLLSTLLGSV